jgi:hypothetical protein
MKYDVKVNAMIVMIECIGSIARIRQQLTFTSKPRVRSVKRFGSLQARASSVA